jgi:hypothetical protein
MRFRRWIQQLKHETETDWEGAAIPEQSLERPWAADAATLSMLDREESPAVLAGRLEGCQQERNALRAQVRQLLDQRDVLVMMLQQVMAERDAARAERG